MVGYTCLQKRYLNDTCKKWQFLNIQVIVFVLSHSTRQHVVVTLKQATPSLVACNNREEDYKPLNLVLGTVQSTKTSSDVDDVSNRSKQ